MGVLTHSPLAVIVFLQAALALAVPGPLASIALPTVHSGGGAAHVQRALSKGAAAYRPVKAGGSLPSLNLAALEAAGDADVKPEQCAAVLATAYVCVLVWAVCRSTPPPPLPTHASPDLGSGRGLHL